jgi:hypothetical protein
VEAWAIPQHEQIRDANRWQTYVAPDDEYESVGGLGRGF